MLIWVFQGKNRETLNVVRLIGAILGLTGTLLDFSSGYLILTQSMVTTNDMGMIVNRVSPAALAWGVGISILGVILLVTTILSVSSVGTDRMDVFGPLMIAYGVAMLFVGGSMYSGNTPMMQGSLPSSLGMFVIGALMTVNGILMWRTRSMM